jgi:protease I
MATTLIIIAQQGFQDHEFAIPKNILEHAGHTVTIASRTRALCTGKFGMEVSPDITIQEVFADAFDVLLIVGGPGAPALAEDESLLGLIQEMDAQKKLICAICIAPTILAKAGILGQKRATVFAAKEAIELLTQSDAIHLDEHVVCDGHIITADGPDAAEEFARCICETLEEMHTST